MRIRHPLFFFSGKEKKQIVTAIQEAERNTSGEIRVHLERKVKGDILRHAGHVFERIGMTKTKDRNGVLIFLSVSDRKFAILGDQGINEKVPADFWKDVAEIMQENFKEGRFAEGIVEAVRLAGIKLKVYFPFQAGDKNELSDGIST